MATEPPAPCAPAVVIPFVPAVVSLPQTTNHCAVIHCAVIPGAVIPGAVIPGAVIPGAVIPGAVSRRMPAAENGVSIVVYDQANASLSSSHMFKGTPCLTVSILRAYPTLTLRAHPKIRHAHTMLSPQISQAPRSAHQWPVCAQRACVHAFSFWHLVHVRFIKPYNIYY